MTALDWFIFSDDNEDIHLTYVTSQDEETSLDHVHQTKQVTNAREAIDHAGHLGGLPDRIALCLPNSCDKASSSHQSKSTGQIGPQKADEECDWVLLEQSDTETTDQESSTFGPLDKDSLNEDLYEEQDAFAKTSSASHRTPFEFVREKSCIVQ